MTHIINHAMAMREKGGRYVFSLSLRRVRRGGLKRQITSHLSVAALVSIFLNGSFHWMQSSSLPARSLLVQLWCSTRPGAVSASVTSIAPSWKKRARRDGTGKLCRGKIFSTCNIERSHTCPVDQPEEESRIWPLEVGLVFSQVEGADSLALGQQNKLKANINQLWLERMSTTEIITIAGGLVSSMQGPPMREIIVDNFAGGGGASTGIELAIGRSVDIAINHDENAIAMHKTNHPDTLHYCESVFDVDPSAATSGKPVGTARFSPDCRHFSKRRALSQLRKRFAGWRGLSCAGRWQYVPAS